MQRDETLRRRGLVLLSKHRYVVSCREGNEENRARMEENWRTESIPSPTHANISARCVKAIKWKAKLAKSEADLRNRLTVQCMWGNADLLDDRGVHWCARQVPGPSNYVGSSKTTGSLSSSWLSPFYTYQVYIDMFLAYLYHQLSSGTLMACVRGYRNSVLNCCMPPLKFWPWKRQPY